MRHPFFKEMDWAALEAREVRPPFRPKVRSRVDVTNFDKEFTETSPVLTPIDPDLTTSIDQSEFAGFSYVNPEFSAKRPQALSPQPNPVNSGARDEK